MIRRLPGLTTVVWYYRVSSNRQFDEPPRDTRVGFYIRMTSISKQESLLLMCYNRNTQRLVFQMQKLYNITTKLPSLWMWTSLRTQWRASRESCQEVLGQEESILSDCHIYWYDLGRQATRCGRLWQISQGGWQMSCHHGQHTEQ